MEYINRSLHTSTTPRSFPVYDVPMKHCVHAESSCQLTSTDCCCFCLDKRPISGHGRYDIYIDGLGVVNEGRRWEMYCGPCKEYWSFEELLDQTIDLLQESVPHAVVDDEISRTHALVHQSDHARLLNTFRARQQFTQEDQLQDQSERSIQQIIQQEPEYVSLVRSLVRDQLDSHEHNEQYSLQREPDLAFIKNVLLRAHEWLKDKQDATVSNAHSEAEPEYVSQVRALFRLARQWRQEITSSWIHRVKPREDRPEPLPKEALINIECKICFSQVSNTVFLPCAHLAVCEFKKEQLIIAGKWCAYDIAPLSERKRGVQLQQQHREPQCPICRTEIKKTMKIFMV
ncbi:hypothetical protein V1514DRAFT_343410 [Lipomyces japonicus]|uniref:uncharacterized protein n=1 Tax=Lipomyces japonicus TaxID=56871 RepID=UPI0034CD6251